MIGWLHLVQHLMEPLYCHEIQIRLRDLFKICKQNTIQKLEINTSKQQSLDVKQTGTSVELVSVCVSCCTGGGPIEFSVFQNISGQSNFKVLSHVTIYSFHLDYTINLVPIYHLRLSGPSHFNPKQHHLNIGKFYRGHFNFFSSQGPCPSFFWDYKAILYILL